MNLTEYIPQSDKFIVFECIGDPMKEINGIISAFVLALMANYNFRINGLDKSPFADVFSSSLDWWNNDWKSIGWKHGIWNLKNLSNEDIRDIKSSTIRSKFYNTQVLHFYCEDNIIPHIFANPNYEEALDIFEIQNESLVYKQVIEVLFAQIENDYQPNFEFLVENLNKYKNPTSIRVDESTSIEKIKELSEHDFIYVSCSNPNYYIKLKNEITNLNLSHIKTQLKENSEMSKVDKISKLLELSLLMKINSFNDLCSDSYGNFLDRLINPK